MVGTIEVLDYFLFLEAFLQPGQNDNKKEKMLKITLLHFVIKGFRFRIPEGKIILLIGIMSITKSVKKFSCTYFHENYLCD